MTEQGKKYLKELLDTYGDDIYRFAMILTLSEKQADKTVTDAAVNVASAEMFVENPLKSKNAMLKQIYKLSSKRASSLQDGAFIDSAGSDDGEFREFLSLPLKARAETHLSLYEDMTEEEIKEITG